MLTSIDNFTSLRIHICTYLFSTNGLHSLFNNFLNNIFAVKLNKTETSTFLFQINWKVYIGNLERKKGKICQNKSFVSGTKLTGCSFVYYLDFHGLLHVSMLQESAKE